VFIEIPLLNECIGPDPSDQIVFIYEVSRILNEQEQSFEYFWS